MITWKRVPRGMLKPDYEMFYGDTFTGIVVRHCGHPTALRPYFLLGLREDEVDGLGAYRLLNKTKALAETIYRARIEDAQ